MTSLRALMLQTEALLNKLRSIFGFTAPLGLRLYLAPVMIAAGMGKLQNFEGTVQWFGGSLGLPFPEVMVGLSVAAEVGGGLALLFGFLTRLATVPLMVTMLVAIFAVHWDNGWFAIAPSHAKTSTAAPLAAVGIPAAKRSLENSNQVGQNLALVRKTLRQAEVYKQANSTGRLVVLNNGIEFAVTYLLMLMVLFFQGAGKYTSVDYWLWRKIKSSN